MDKESIIIYSHLHVKSESSSYQMFYDINTLRKLLILLIGLPVVDKRPQLLILGFGYKYFNCLKQFRNFIF